MREFERCRERPVLDADDVEAEGVGQPLLQESARLQQDAMLLLLDDAADDAHAHRAPVDERPLGRQRHAIGYDGELAGIDRRQARALGDEARAAEDPIEMAVDETAGQGMAHQALGSGLQEQRAPGAQDRGGEQERLHVGRDNPVRPYVGCDGAKLAARRRHAAQRMPGEDEDCGRRGGRAAPRGAGCPPDPADAAPRRRSSR